MSETSFWFILPAFNPLLAQILKVRVKINHCGTPEDEEGMCDLTAGDEKILGP